MEEPSPVLMTGTVPFACLLSTAPGALCHSGTVDYHMAPAHASIATLANADAAAATVDTAVQWCAVPGERSFAHWRASLRTLSALLTHSTGAHGHTLTATGIERPPDTSNPKKE